VIIKQYLYIKRLITRRKVAMFFKTKVYWKTWWSTTKLY